MEANWYFSTNFEFREIIKPTHIKCQQLGAARAKHRCCGVSSALTMFEPAYRKLHFGILCFLVSVYSFLLVVTVFTCTYLLAGASTLGVLLRNNQDLILLIGGVLIVVFGTMSLIGKGFTGMSAESSEILVSFRTSLFGFRACASSLLFKERSSRCLSCSAPLSIVARLE